MAPSFFERASEPPAPASSCCLPHFSTCLRPRFDFPLSSFPVLSSLFHLVQKTSWPLVREVLQEEALLLPHDLAQRGGTWITPTNREDFHLLDPRFKSSGGAVEAGDAQEEEQRWFLWRCRKHRPSRRRDPSGSSLPSPKHRGSTSCYQFLTESPAGTEGTGGTVCDTSRTTVCCSPSSFLSRSQLIFFFTATCPFCPSGKGGVSPITEFCRKMPTKRQI